MEIKVFREDSYTFKITNDDDFDGIKLFFSIFNKCEAEAKRKGFKNMFNKEEKVFIIEFNKVLKHDADS